LILHALIIAISIIGVFINEKIRTQKTDDIKFGDNNDLHFFQ
jgi:hypothetical protein